MDVTTDGSAGVDPATGLPMGTEPPPLDVGAVAIKMYMGQMSMKLASKLTAAADSESDEGFGSMMSP